MLRATLDEAVPVQLQLSDGATNLYAQAKIYEGLTGSLVTTLSLPHITEGLYGTTYTFTSMGYYTIVYRAFNDAGFTSPANFDIEVEMVEANSDKTNILRILGLTHDNTVLDNQTYDSQGNLTGARVRSYDTKTNAITAGASGLQNTWTISAVYSGGQLTKYSVLRES